MKGKTMKKFFKLLKIDSQGRPVYDGLRLRCKSGYTNATFKNGKLSWLISINFNKSLI